MQFFAQSELDKKKLNNEYDESWLEEENSQDDEDVRKIMEIYKEDRTMAYNMMIEKLHNLIYYIIQRKYHTYATNGNADDMFQEACLKIMQAMDNYDVNVAAPSTYMKYHIAAGINECIHRDYYNTTPYYAKIMKKIRQIKSERAVKGLDTTEEDIVQILGMKSAKLSTATLRECYQRVIASDQDCHYEEAVIDNLITTENTSFDTPEALLLNKEKQKNLYKALNKLTDIERYVLICTQGLYQTDKDEIKNILQNYTEFSKHELFVANGYKPAQVLSLFGFSMAETFVLHGLSKDDAIYAETIFTNKTDDDSDRFMGITNYLSSKEASEVFEKNFNEQVFRKVLEEFGHDIAEINSIINGQKVSHIRLADVKDLSVKQLMIGKGYEESDIKKIICGQPLSNKKIAPLLNVKQNDIKGIETRAIKKLTRILKSEYEVTAKPSAMTVILNQAELKIQPDVMEYASAFYDDIEDVEDLILDV